MGITTALPNNHPFMLAWKEFTSTAEYSNALKWSLAETYDDGREISAENRKNHVEGGLWLAFTKGMELAAPSVSRETSAGQRTRFKDFDDTDHPANIWWKKHGQFMMAGGGYKEFIWACRGWIAREQFTEGVEVTGESELGGYGSED